MKNEYQKTINACFIGYILQAIVNNFVPLLAAVVLYAIGGGLLEVLVSPVVEACPSEHKEQTMSLLHSFYCWGMWAWY